MSFLDKIKSLFGGSSAPAVEEPPAKKEKPVVAKPAAEAEPVAEDAPPEAAE